jgi:hypothetical protein
VPNVAHTYHLVTLPAVADLQTLLLFSPDRSVAEGHKRQPKLGINSARAGVAVGNGGRRVRVPLARPCYGCSPREAGLWSVDEFDALVAEFLAVEKVAHVRPRWQTKGHSEYASAQMVVSVPGSRRLVGILFMTAHAVRLPPKYGFSLTLRGKRIVGLDVGPARTHRNLLSPTSVGTTHWQRWPNMEAKPDDREQNFLAWFRDLLRRANIAVTFDMPTPPRGVQLRLVYGGKTDNRR